MIAEKIKSEPRLSRVFWLVSLLLLLALLILSSLSSLSFTMPLLPEIGFSLDFVIQTPAIILASFLVLHALIFNTPWRNSAALLLLLLVASSQNLMTTSFLFFLWGIQFLQLTKDNSKLAFLGFLAFFGILVLSLVPQGLSGVTDVAKYPKQAFFLLEEDFVFSLLFLLIGIFAILLLACQDKSLSFQPYFLLGLLLLAYNYAANFTPSHQLIKLFFVALCLFVLAFRSQSAAKAFGELRVLLTASIFWLSYFAVPEIQVFGYPLPLYLLLLLAIPLFELALVNSPCVKNFVLIKSLFVVLRACLLLGIFYLICFVLSARQISSLASDSWALLAGGMIAAAWLRTAWLSWKHPEHQYELNLQPIFLLTLGGCLFALLIVSFFNSETLRYVPQLSLAKITWFSEGALAWFGLAWVIKKSLSHSENLKEELASYKNQFLSMLQALQNFRLEQKMAIRLDLAFWVLLGISLSYVVLLEESFFVLLADVPFLFWVFSGLVVFVLALDFWMKLSDFQFFYMVFLPYFLLCLLLQDIVLLSLGVLVVFLVICLHIPENPQNLKIQPKPWLQDLLKSLVVGVFVLVQASSLLQAAPNFVPGVAFAGELVVFCFCLLLIGLESLSKKRK